jgi:hypothetical protein
MLFEEVEKPRFLWHQGLEPAEHPIFPQSLAARPRSNQ